MRPGGGEQFRARTAAVDVNVVKQVGLSVLAVRALHDEAVASLWEEGLEGDAG